MTYKIYKLIEGGIEYDIEEYSTNGFKYWYYKGKCHRELGPAVECSDGQKEYFLNGIHYPNVNSIDELIIASIIE